MTTQTTADHSIYHPAQQAIHKALFIHQVTGGIELSKAITGALTMVDVDRETLTQYIKDHPYSTQVCLLPI